MSRLSSIRPVSYTHLFGFALAASMGLTLIAATVVGGVFALINYQMTMMKATGAVGGASADYDDEEDI